MANVLVIGAGGREHALVRSLAQSSQVETVFVSPGNDGMRDDAQLVSLHLSDIQGISTFIEENKIDLTVIGPEAPLVDGLPDALRGKGHLVLGASQKATQLEGSKSFAKKFMEKHGLPTAAFRVFTDATAAKAFAHSPEGKDFLIVKADGLAAGKGVFVCETRAEVDQAIDDCLTGQKLGKAGETIVLEEKLSGPEVSVIALTDGTTLRAFPASQDHKRAFDGDKGPNTGGMGAYTPVPVYTNAIRSVVESTLFSKFLKGLSEEELPYRGVIYFGLMLTPKGPMILEFNVRFGDPEAQTILPLLASDSFDVFRATAEGTLMSAPFALRKEAACTVVFASGGYPGSFEKGFPIAGLEEAARDQRVTICHAGTKTEGGKFVTTGGRVLNITGRGQDIHDAAQAAYNAIQKINFKNGFYRKDIAHQALSEKLVSR